MTRQPQQEEHQLKEEEEEPKLTHMPICTRASDR